MLHHIISTESIAEHCCFFRQAEHWRHEAMSTRVSGLLANARESIPIEQVEVLMHAPYNQRGSTVVSQLDSATSIYPS